MFADLRKTAIAAALLLFGCALSTAALAMPTFGAMEFSTSPEGDAVETFKPNTRTIYLHVDLADVAASIMITAVWIAEQTDAAPADHRLDSVDVSAKAGAEEAYISLGKPNKGWPPGTYRVDLMVNGKVNRSAHFSVAR